MTDVFEFRDFSMRQAASGQRINTDSCVFAATIGEMCSPKRIIDIGSGTGVVALFLASRFPAAEIVAVEPDEEICGIARDNMRNSPWRTQLRVERLRAQDLTESTFGLFDFVVCNPPYFHKSSPSQDLQRQVARHTTTLDPREMFAAFGRVIAPEGTAWFSCPASDDVIWRRWGLEAGFFEQERVELRDHPTAMPHVTISGLSRADGGVPVFREINYRISANGLHSPWMRQYRDRWFPAKYN